MSQVAKDKHTPDSSVFRSTTPSDGAATCINGVVIGLLVGLTEKGIPLVAFPGNKSETAIAAQSTAELSSEQIGREVALLFESGDPQKPIVVGLIQHPADSKLARETPTTKAEVDGERLVFRAQREIVLQCGKASITLTRAGKVLIRGAYLLSRSSGANRIKGGSIQLN